MVTKFIAIFFVVCYQSILAQNCDTCAVFVPNSLTPDCDQFGCEFLHIESNCEMNDFELAIYNRWGELLFHSFDQQKEFNSSDVKDGTYLWVLNCAFCEEQKFKRNGYFNVIR